MHACIYTRSMPKGFRLRELTYHHTYIHTRSMPKGFRLRELTYFPPLQETALTALRRALETQRKHDDVIATEQGLSLSLTSSHGNSENEVVGSEALASLEKEVR
jgi:hypothetical protein